MIADNAGKRFNYQLSSAIEHPRSDDISYTSVVGIQPNSTIPEPATLYFDQAFKQIILESPANAETQRPYKIFYSADEAFRALAKDLHNPDGDFPQVND